MKIPVFQAVCLAIAQPPEFETFLLDHLIPFAYSTAPLTMKL